TALLPVIGTALFIRYGTRQRITGIYWWAELTPSTRMGDWSYAIYLWHWPLIIAAGYLLDPLTWPYKLGLIALTFALSAASQKLIEDPLRKAKPFKIPKRAFTLMASNIAIIAALTFFIPTLLSPNTNEDVAIDECTGANALLTNCQDQGLEGQPEISATQVQLEAEEPTYTECNVPEGYTDFGRSGCSLGASEDSAEFTIAVLGDSHARAWLPMLDEIGRENNWNIQGYTKSGCTPVPLSSAEEGADQAAREESEACKQFVKDSSEEFQNSDQIDAIVTAASPADRDFYDESGASSDDITSEALNDMWQEWEDAGKDAIVIGEVPHFEELNGPTCIEANPDNVVEACSVPADDIIEARDTSLTWAAEKESSLVSLYDPVPGVCDENRRYSMAGGLITRYDHHHLSSDFARSYDEHFVSFLSDQLSLDS
ncbi:acyltransferase family protein, partial [Yaniella flava]|uniref:acyltransferase family protein n=1 Tax=Yaniella flava TaxID=287930 RepID=UPI0031DC3B83